MAAEHVKKLVLMGAGGTSADVLSIIADINRMAPAYECIGLLDDDPALWGKRRFSVNVLGGLEQAGSMPDVFFVNCLGSPNNYWRRRTALARLAIDRDRFETLIHPRAAVATDCRIGRGSVLYPNVVVMANVRIGDHVTILGNTVMNHDVDIDDLCIITSGVNISGRVRIGQSAYIGTGATLKHGISIGEHALVGMGSVVLHDVPPRAVVAGNPARQLRTIDPAS
jgi:sugar O-acyltransferase (sialic acid O-acetyltransferase NeuD family)